MNLWHGHAGVDQMGTHRGAVDLENLECSLPNAHFRILGAALKCHIGVDPHHDQQLRRSNRSVVVLFPLDELASEP